MININGRTIFDLKSYIKNNCDQTKYDQIFDTCKLDSTKKLKNTPILSFEWYDLEIYKDLINSYCNFVPNNLENVAEYLANQQIRGFYGVVLKFWSINKLMDNIEKKWKKYYSAGEFKAIMIDEKVVEVSVKGISFDPNLIELTKFYMKKMGEKAAKKKVKAEILEKRSNSVKFKFTILDS